MSPDFHFLRPAWLLALLPFWLCAWAALGHARRDGAWSRICDAALLPFVLETRAARHRTRATLLLGMAGSLAILALAGPVWERLPVPVFRNDSALVIALDLSRSMNAADLTPSRLARAKFELTDLLRLRRDGQTALLVFAAQSFVVTPLTDDSATIDAQLAALDPALMPMQGSAPQVALERAGELLHQAGVGGGHVLLITDGSDPEGLAAATAYVAEQPFRTSVLALGTPEGAPIPDASGGFLKDPGGGIVMARLEREHLAALAAAGRGLYLEAQADDADLARYLAFLDEARTHDAERLSDLRATQWREVGPWLLLPLLPLAAVAFRRGLLVLLAALILAPAPPARADWWATPDQAGQRAYRQGEYAAAAEHYTDRGWRGAARYRAGDYAGALEDFAAGDDPRMHYNRGNALARLGRYEEAVAAYDKALELAPDDADSAYNKALIEKLLAENRPPPDQAGQHAQQEPGQKDDAQRDGQQGADDPSSGGQEQQEERTDLSAGNAGGGAGGEQTEPAATPPGKREAGAAEERREAKDNGEDEPGADDEPAAAQVARNAAAEAEAEQATEQWLRQIPDDPAGLLRRKFQYQYKQRYGNQPYAGDRW